MEVVYHHNCEPGFRNAWWEWFNTADPVPTHSVWEEGSAATLATV